MFIYTKLYIHFLNFYNYDYVLCIHILLNCTRKDFYNRLNKDGLKQFEKKNSSIIMQTYNKL